MGEDTAAAADESVEPPANTIPDRDGRYPWPEIQSVRLKVQKQRNADGPTSNKTQHNSYLGGVGIIFSSQLFVFHFVPSNPLSEFRELFGKNGAKTNDPDKSIS